MTRYQASIEMTAQALATLLITALVTITIALFIKGLVNP